MKFASIHKVLDSNGLSDRDESPLSDLDRLLGRMPQIKVFTKDSAGKFAAQNPIVEGKPAPRAASEVVLRLVDDLDERVSGRVDRSRTGKRSGLFRIKVDSCHCLKSLKKKRLKGNKIVKFFSSSVPVEIFERFAKFLQSVEDSPMNDEKGVTATSVIDATLDEFDRLFELRKIVAYCLFGHFFKALKKVSKVS